MTTEKDRRLADILKILEERTAPISGADLAREFGISRQVIVQDIALLKARNVPVLSTNRGYMLAETPRSVRIFKVSHRDEDIEEELNAIVDLGATVKDVYVNHRIYGEIRVEMNIRSRRDVTRFLNDLRSGVSSPLKNLTKNYHYHTIEASDEATLDDVEQHLIRKGYLISHRKSG